MFLYTFFYWPVVSVLMCVNSCVYDIFFCRCGEDDLESGLVKFESHNPLKMSDVV